MFAQKVKELPNKFIIPEIKKLIDEGRTVTFRVKGQSMHPFLVGGRDDVVLQSLNRPLRKYDVILAEVAPELYMIHRIIGFEQGHIIMKGDGNRAQKEVVSPQNVLGIVIAFRRKGRTTLDTVESYKWKLYSRIWLLLSPFHFLLLPFYRRIWLRFFSKH